MSSGWWLGAGKELWETSPVLGNPKPKSEVVEWSDFWITDAITDVTLYDPEFLLSGVSTKNYPNEPSYAVGGNVNWYSHYGKQYGGSSKKLKIELPYDTAIPLLDIYPEKTIIWKDTCTPVFIAALFTIAKTWRKPKCPLTDEWIKKMWYIYIMEYYSAIKRMK